MDPSHWHGLAQRYRSKYLYEGKDGDGTSRPKQCHPPLTARAHVIFPASAYRQLAFYSAAASQSMYRGLCRRVNFCPRDWIVIGAKYINLLLIYLMIRIDGSVALAGSRYSLSLMNRIGDHGCPHSRAGGMLTWKLNPTSTSLH
jgi:hypothetical protein